MNDSFVLDQSQEIELLCCIYEYFLWKTEQEKEKEKAVKKGNSRSVRSKQKTSNDSNDNIIPEYLRYQSVLDILNKNFTKHKSNFAKTTTVTPRLIEALFIDVFPKSQQQKKRKEQNNGQESRKSKRKVNKENNILESPKAKKKSRVSISSPKTNRFKTKQSIGTSTVLCDNTKNITSPADINNTKTTLSDATSTVSANTKTDIDSVKDPGKSANLETLESLPTRNETPATTNDDNTPGAASNDSSNNSKSEKKQFPSFDERFKDLENFKAGNGHTRVPVKTVLGQWVSRIRGKKRLMDQGKPFDGKPLSEEQIERLDSLGFEWNVAPTPLPFEQRFEELVKFKEIEGHCDVPRSYENDKSLAEWVHTLRCDYRKKSKSLTAERIKKLESIGFNWIVGQKKKTFEERLEECRNYRRQHGHLKIAPINKSIHKVTYESEEGNFRRWVDYIRNQYKLWKAGKKSTINKARFNELEKIGFDWTYDDLVDYKPKPYKPRKPKAKETFDQRLQELKELKEKVGSCNSLPDFVKAGYTEQSKLYQWMKLQRKYWRINKLSEEKVEKLKELDFDFQPRRHYAPYGSKKEAAAAKAQKTDESKEQLSLQNVDGQFKEDSTGIGRSRNDDETSSESENDERNDPVQLQNNIATSAHALYQGFGIDTCRL